MLSATNSTASGRKSSQLYYKRILVLIYILSQPIHCLVTHQQSILPISLVPKPLQPLTMEVKLPLTLSFGQIKVMVLITCVPHGSLDMHVTTTTLQIFTIPPCIPLVQAIILRHSR